MSADGPPATAADLRERVRQARQDDRTRLEAEASATMQTVADAMSRSSEQLLSAWTRFLRESLTATAEHAAQETARTTTAAGQAARTEMAATSTAAVQRIARTSQAATQQIAQTGQGGCREVEEAARRAIAALDMLDREAERIGRASRSLARWPLILATAAAIAILASALWARAAILPDTTTATRPDGTTVTVLSDPDWTPCPEGLCKTAATTPTAGG